MCHTISGKRNTQFSRWQKRVNAKNISNMIFLLDEKKKLSSLSQLFRDWGMDDEVTMSLERPKKLDREFTSSTSSRVREIFEMKCWIQPAERFIISIDHISISPIFSRMSRVNTQQQKQLPICVLGCCRLRKLSSRVFPPYLLPLQATTQTPGRRFTHTRRR